MKTYLIIYETDYESDTILQGFSSMELAKEWILKNVSAVEYSRHKILEIPIDNEQAPIESYKVTPMFENKADK